MRPIEHLQAAGSMYPNAWRQVEDFRADRGQGLPNWPDWCFLPMAAWYAIVSEGGKMPLNRVPDVGRLAAIGTWRYTQGVYRFDSSVFDALRETVPSGDMPVDVLYRLPEWSVYIETPGHKWLGTALNGFWAHLEFDINAHRPELRLLLDTADNLLPIPLHMGKWTITEAVDRTLSEVVLQGRKALGVDVPTADPAEIAAELYGLVSLVLYLCSDEPELMDNMEPGVSPKRPSPTRTKKGLRLFPASRPRIWRAGENLGEKLRKSLSESSIQGGKKSAHIRRAHWHGFWTGPREGERNFHYKWLPPTLIGADR